MNKKLVRPKHGRVLFGVAQGLGEYFDIDPVIIRILFVIFTISGGAGILLYIIGILLIPDEMKDTIREEVEEIKKNHHANNNESVEEKTSSAKISKQRDSSIIFGLIVLFVGLMFLFSNFLPWLSWGKFWPVILIFFGLLIIADARKE
jgi:phage shock protein C